MSTIFFQTTGVIVKTLGERKCFLFNDTLNTFYGLMASNMWLRVPVREITHCCHFMGSNTPLNRQINIYTMAFVTLIMKYWLEWEIVHWVHHKELIQQPIASWAGQSLSMSHFLNYFLIQIISTTDIVWKNFALLIRCQTYCKERKIHCLYNKGYSFQLATRDL